MKYFYCESMMATAAGEVVAWGQTQPSEPKTKQSGKKKQPQKQTETDLEKQMRLGILQARWYGKQGNLLHTLPRPAPDENDPTLPYCEHNGGQRILAVEVGEADYIILSCAWCQTIWLGSPGMKGSRFLPMVKFQSALIKNKFK